MRQRVSCGIIPVHKEPNGTIRFLLVQGHGNYWGFPKGHKEDNETHRETAIRELQEETQIVCDILLPNIMLSERYRIPKKRGTDIIKKVFYFIGRVSDTRVVRQTTEIKNHGWFTSKEAKEKLIDSRKKMIDEVIKHVKINS